MPRLAPFVPLDTPRLALVALNLDHAPAVFAYASDSDISRLVSWPRHETLETTRRLIALSMVGYVEGGHYEWGVVRRSDQAFLGTCGLGDIDTIRGVGELSYVLAKKYWGHGYATEAASAVLRFGFVQLGLRAVEAHAFSGNVASFRVMTKLGLRYLETRPFEGDRDDAPGPVSVWQIEYRQWARAVNVRARAAELA
jgi:ribosomal-protein-alanine N-acetyltransferase